MRLKLVLSLAAILAFSCQNNSSEVQNSTSDNMEVSNSLTSEEYKSEFNKLKEQVKTVFLKESDNKTRAQRLSKFFLKSKLSQKDKNDILKKEMLKLELSTEDVKEISLHLSHFRKMDLKK